MVSVQTWAKSKGWEYEHCGDEFFELAPEWVRERCAGNIYAVTDICRLQWLRMQLEKGYERVIWADADILVFSPERIDVTTQNGYAFAQELFLSVGKDGRVKVVRGINNALMVFERDQSTLDLYLEICLNRLLSLPIGAVPRTALGPELLSEIEKKKPLDILEGIGLFTLAIMRQIAAGGGPLTILSERLSSRPLGAANLCNFLRNATLPAHRASFDALYDRGVERLIKTEGRVLTPTEKTVGFS